ncbi:hypothetical protein [Hyphococcus luteus]|uniref:Uncharacterized protein n=1 Tax=Hyphococcus luteus TaxID=2058213 RepID=A0A2S7K2R9_9PROT|nr:hypothetical protein [Marinicaulis flavus]PQA86748.1 hypothetical protein CW354_14760 [Marinicaulis flavus]
MVEKKKKTKTKLTQVTDKNQSEQFRKVARELEADGELDLTEAEEKFEKAIDKLTKKRAQPSDSES